MLAINRKLLRNLWSMKGQVVAIILIIGCGVGVLLTMLTAYSGLKGSLASYYSNYRIYDLFANVKRAPRSVILDLEEIEGVRKVQSRIVFDVTLDMPDLELPASGRIISAPARRRKILCDLHLTRGRWFEGDGTREVIVAQRFADEHDLEVGDRLKVIMNNKKESLHVVGIALSPEFVYLIRGGGEIIPDAKHFTVLWVSRSFAESVFGYEDACNDIVATLSRDARLEEVIDAFDRRLDRYGGFGAYGRKDQLSHRSVHDEIEGLKASATMMPTIFLGVAAFVLNMVLRRLVQTQRPQIALMRALGYSTADVVVHYLKLALLIGFLGAAAGTGLGYFFGSHLGELYAAFFSFPVLVFYLDPLLVAIGFGVSLFSAVLGALGAVRTVARLDPAEGLRPESPQFFKRTLVEWLPAVWRQLGFASRMILRNIARTKLRTAVTITGVALAASVLMLTFFAHDSLDELMDNQFRLVQRHDIRVTFHDERSRAALYELRRLDGVRTVEGNLGVGVRLRNGWRSRRTGINGLERDHSLHGLLDRESRPVSLPEEGLLLSSKLAQLLNVEPGDEVAVEVLTGEKQKFAASVAQVVEEYLGAFAYADIGWLSGRLGEELALTGASLHVDDARAADLGRELKNVPAVSAVDV
ncbi:MAG: ABC transporter permease, partial [Planctomycetota bacterium]